MPTLIIRMQIPWFDVWYFSIFFSSKFYIEVCYSKCNSLCMCYSKCLQLDILNCEKMIHRFTLTTKGIYVHDFYEFLQFTDTTDVILVSFNIIFPRVYVGFLKHLLNIQLESLLSSLICHVTFWNFHLYYTHHFSLIFRHCIFVFLFVSNC